MGSNQGEATIIEFISSLEDYSGAIPDQVIEYYLQRTGFSSQDVKVYEYIIPHTKFGKENA